MTHDEIIKALQDYKFPSALIHEISASIYRLYDNIERAQDRTGRLRAEAVSQAHALTAAIKSANLWASIAEQRQANVERLEAENAALRARLDKCCAELLVDAEGR